MATEEIQMIFYPSIYQTKKLFEPKIAFFIYFYFCRSLHCRLKLLERLLQNIRKLYLAL